MHVSVPGYVSVCVSVVVCIPVSYSHAKQLATSEEAWPVLCMFQRVALHVSRSTTSQNPNHTHTKACVQMHTQRHTEIGLRDSGNGNPCGMAVRTRCVYKQLS